MVRRCATSRSGLVVASAQHEQGDATGAGLTALGPPRVRRLTIGGRLATAVLCKDVTEKVVLPHDQ